MKFLQTYKRLDNLCRQTNGIGVTGYLEDMEQNPDGANLVPRWAEDYKQLKHYRYLRNQIVHEVTAEEEDLCSAEDVAWLENFYGRILGTNDPLALCRKAKTVPSGPDPRLIFRMNGESASTSKLPAAYRKTTPPSPAPKPFLPPNSGPARSWRYASSHEGEIPPKPPQRPRQQPSAPHTGLALWLLFAACIALFFLSEFFR